VGRKTEEQSKFDKFVRGFGVEELARRLEINPSAIYHWLRGKNIPDPKNAIKVQKLAKRRGVELSLDEIYQPSREVRTETSSMKPQHARV
jgi:transcriptional regulator with XRE-family HTH domain